MSLPIEAMTPAQTVAELDKYIVGQQAAKRAVAVALRNRWRRQQLPRNERDDITPKNILMIGPTGVGKTEIARRLAHLARAPFIKVEATKFTEVGYVGRDVESMVRDLAALAVRLVETERVEAVRADANEAAVEQLVDILDGPNHVSFSTTFFSPFSTTEIETPEDPAKAQAEEEARQVRRAEWRRQIEANELNDRIVDIETEEAGGNQFLQVFTPQGMEEMGVDMNQLMGRGSTHYVTRRVSVSEALELLTEQEASKRLDKTSVTKEAVYRTEQTGIIFLDEIDKIAMKSGGSGPDVSREGVQRDLLPIIEGSTVPSKYGPIRTDHILFIAAGAFNISKPSDLIPELQGRLPIRVELESLGEDDFRRILSEPKNALTRQYEKLLSVEGVQLVFTSAALDEVAHMATEANKAAGNTGARRLQTLLERLLEDLMYQATDLRGQTVTIDVADVREKLGPIVRDAAKNQALI